MITPIRIWVYYSNIICKLHKSRMISYPWSDFKQGCVTLYSSMSDLLEKLRIAQIIKKISAFCES